MQPDTAHGPLTLAIFGATSSAGKEVVTLALDAGYRVVALARTPDKLPVSNHQFTVVQGDILDAERVAEVVSQADVVLSVLGPSDNKPTFTISRGMQNILDAMNAHHVRRLILSAGAAVRDANDHPKLFDRAITLALRLLANNVKLDMERVVELVRASDREWTVVRVPRLVDGPRQGRLKVGYVGDIGASITRADLAAFMLQQVAETSFVRKAPAISN